MKKHSIAKVIFFVTLLPYALTLAFACFGAIFGYYDPPLLPSASGGGATVYGFEAFGTIIIMFGYMLLCVIVPVIPVCAVYQIVYLIAAIVKKVESAPDFSDAKKVKRRKIWFFVSLAPYLLLIVGIVVNAFGGIRTWDYVEDGLGGEEWVLTSEVYGFETVKDSVEGLLMVFWPIIAAALIYQTVYIVSNVRKKAVKE